MARRIDDVGCFVCALGYGVSIRGELALGRVLIIASRPSIRCGVHWTRTMMQPWASTAKLRDGGSNLDRGMKAIDMLRPSASSARDPETITDKGTKPDRDRTFRSAEVPAAQAPPEASHDRGPRRHNRKSFLVSCTIPAISISKSATPSPLTSPLTTVMSLAVPIWSNVW